MQKIVRYLLSLPVFPPGEIVQAVSNIRPEIADDDQHVEDLKTDQQRLSVRDNRISSH